MIETFVQVLNLSVEIDLLISTLIEKINIDSKISLIFSTHINTGGTKVII